jgi:hypothetical protein
LFSEKHRVFNRAPVFGRNILPTGSNDARIKLIRGMFGTRSSYYNSGLETEQVFPNQGSEIKLLPIAQVVKIPNLSAIMKTDSLFVSLYSILSAKARDFY